MAKITKLETKTYPGKDPSTTVTLDNGISGYLQKDSDQGLKEGDDVIETVKPYTSKAGKTSNLVTLKRGAGATNAPNAPNLPLSKPPEPRSPLAGIPALEIFKAKAEANLRVMEVVLNAFFDGKIDNLKSVEKFNEWKIIMENTVDEIARDSK